PPFRSRTLGFRRPQRRQAARRKAVRVEHETARVDQAHDAERERLPFHLRDHGSERPPDLPETEQHHVAALGVRHRAAADLRELKRRVQDRKSTRLNSSHGSISYAVFRLKKKAPPETDNARAVSVWNAPQHSKPSTAVVRLAL